MRTPIKLYDKKRIPIKIGDMIKVFHFKGRNRVYYMYKQVDIRDGFLYGKHYPFTFQDGYDLQSQCDENGVYQNAEIIDSINSDYIDFYDRPKLKINKEITK